MVNSTLHHLVLNDLVADLPQAVRLQRLAASLRAHFDCSAVALLQLDDDHLHPVAVDGLSSEVLGRRFAVAAHPRLAAILARREVTFFPEDSPLPDPYDGLIGAPPGTPVLVHDCMGVSLHVEGRPWGVLTLDAARAGTFDARARQALGEFTVLAEAAVRTTRLEAEVRGLRLRGEETPVGGSRPEADEIVGRSEAITRLLHEVDVVADSGLPVLLLGETGVGKELIARRLHQLSRRRARPLVHVNCAALPESLAESELFGHVRGAFSGASADRPGRFEAADGGTLLLDEVGELPLTVQAKLLRVLQEGELQRLGADTPRHVDVRVIAATNRSLRDLVGEGAFRADLYHRLSVYPIPIPPLRERGNDVLLLAGRFLELNRARLGLRSLRLSAESEQALRRYRWPGNVRELEHVISRAALKALSRGARRNEIVTIGPALLDLDASGLPPAQAAAAEPGPPPAAAIAPLRDTVEACQRQAIRQALAAHGGNWARAARQLGLDASNLHKLAQRLGVKGGGGT
ncbi:MAG TPA: nitric oxide reductase transcriptional regulator NorR [Burkholderiales bacterium]|nr:nitric oxide reductase transcriptional regulator NorR [Burkholderiales bacterium]